jgi:integral membrane protein
MTDPHSKAARSWDSAIGQLRICGVAEGISFLLLMGIAMPLKYAFDYPQAVTWVGWAHGILFIAYCLMLLKCLLQKQISFGQSVLGLIAALLPFGPFFMDRSFANGERISSP